MDSPVLTRQSTTQRIHALTLSDTMNPMNPISELPDNEIRRPDNEIRRHEDIHINVMASALEEFNKKLEMTPSWYNIHTNKPGIGYYMLGKYLETHRIEYLDEYLYPSNDLVKTFIGRKKIKEITIRKNDVLIVFDNNSSYVVMFECLVKRYMVNGGNVLIRYTFDNEDEYNRRNNDEIGN